MQDKKLKIKILFLCFVASAFTAALFILPVMIANGGAFTLGTDFNFQQITFMDSAKEHITSGVVWADNLGLGGDVFNILGFYNILSPFSILYYLIPGATNYLYFVGLFAILKFGVMGFTSALFFKRYLKEWQNILFASLLFSFSGTVFFNLNYHFLDSYALIPLLFWALDCAVLDRKKGYLAGAATVLLITNYMMFYMTVVFLAIYFVAKIITKEYIIDKKLFFSLAFESAISVMLSSTILLRALLPTFLNPRFLQQGTETQASPFFYDSYTLATIVKGLILPAESLHDRAFFGDKHTDLPSLWLPVVGIVLVFSYLLRERDKFARILLGTSAVMAAVPILNAVFSLSLNHYYPRWFILPLLFMALYSAKFFETEKRISPLWGLIPIGVCIVAMFYFAVIWDTVVEYPQMNLYIQNLNNVIIYVVVATISLLLTVSVSYLRSRKTAVLILCGAVIVVSTVIGTIIVNSLHSGFVNPPYSFSTEAYFLDSHNTTIEDDSYHRYDNRKSYDNLSIITDKPTVNIFSSTIHQASYEIQELIGEVSNVTLSVQHKINYGFHTLASVKYITWMKSGIYDVYLPGYTMIKNTEHFIVYEYPYHIPMGFTFDSYITTEQLIGISAGDRDLALLKYLVIDEDVSEMIPQDSISYVDVSFESFEADVIERQSETADVFYEIKNGFYSEINLESDNIVFFSIPYDEGFSATVNGESAPIYKVQGGFIGIPAKAGANVIKFAYTPPTLVIEIVLMVVGAIALMIYIFYGRIKKRFFDGRDKKQLG